MDASTLIYLAKVDAFDALGACGGPFVVVPGVWREAVEAGERRGAPEVDRIRAARGAGLLERTPLSGPDARRARELRRVYRLGQGEAEVLAVARSGGRLILDEGRATRVAEAPGLRPVPTILLPVLAFERGGVPAGTAMDWLERLTVVSGTRAEVLLLLSRRIRKESP